MARSTALIIDLHLNPKNEGLLLVQQTFVPCQRSMLYCISWAVPSLTEYKCIKGFGHGTKTWFKCLLDACCNLCARGIDVPPRLHPADQLAWLHRCWLHQASFSISPGNACIRLQRAVCSILPNSNSPSVLHYSQVRTKDHMEWSATSMVCCNLNHSW